MPQGSVLSTQASYYLIYVRLFLFVIKSNIVGYAADMALYASEAVAQRCSVKKVFLEISENSQENTCEFSEISKNTFFYRTLPLAASDAYLKKYLICQEI